MVAKEKRLESRNLENRHQQLISSVLLPAKLVLAKTAQQLQVRPTVGELVLVLIHLGILVCFDDSAVGEGVWHIPVLAQPCIEHQPIRPWPDHQDDYAVDFACRAGL